MADEKNPDDRPLQTGALVPKTAGPREVAVENLISSPALALWFDDRLFDRARTIAKYLSEAEGMVPKHLLGKTAACFAVVSRALTWKMDPYAVAACTYETPGGRVGFEGKLIHAILELSGRLVGTVTYQHYGDWGQVKGKWELKRGSNSGKEYPAPTWGRADAKGLGVVISAQVRGEVERRSLEFDLEDCFPMNSTLWATRPKQQICYTGVRAFANMAAPGLIMGVPFDPEDNLPIRDITPTIDADAPPRPTRAEIVTGRAAPLPVEDVWTFVNEDGEEIGCRSTTQFEELFCEALKHAPNPEVASGIFEANAATLTQIKAIPGAAEAVERIGEAVAAAQARFNAASDAATVVKDSEAARAGAAAPEGRQADGAAAGPTGTAETAQDASSTDAAVAGAAGQPNSQGPSGTAREAPSSEGVQPAAPQSTGATGAAPDPAGAAKVDVLALFENLSEGLADQRTGPEIEQYLQLQQRDQLLLRQHADKALYGRWEKKVATHKERVKRK